MRNASGGLHVSIEVPVEDHTSFGRERPFVVSSREGALLL
jgi:hypothetical protein